MPRGARIVVPGVPHHVTQRGNRRQQTFFREADYLLYLQLLQAQSAAAGVEVWGYCLMPTHVHLIVTPPTQGALASAIGEVHKRYTREINQRERWTGYLWQGRFASFAMDDLYFITASRYVGLNPVRAGYVKEARDWPWSSVGAHYAKQDDLLVRTAPLLSRIDGDVERFFACDVQWEGLRALRRASETGKPLGGRAWLKALEQKTGRDMETRERGRPKAA